jgi:uncharacterized membrane protein
MKAMEYRLDWVIDVVGIIFALLFIYLHQRASRTLTGSVFKRYHFWMIAGAVVFGLAFFADLLGIIGGETAGAAALDVSHHVLFLCAAIIFIATNLRLPQDASRYLELNEKDSKD